MRLYWRSVCERWAEIRVGFRAFLEIAKPIFAPFLAPLRVVLALLAAGVLLDSIHPLLYGRLTDAIVSRKGHTALILLGILIIQSFVRVVISYHRDYYEDEHITWYLNLRVMTNSLERLSGLSISQFASTHSGKTRDVVQHGRDALRELVRLAIYNVGPTILKLAFALIAILCVSIAIGSVAVLGTFVYLSFAVWLFSKNRAPLRDLKNQENNNSKMFADTLANMDVVKVFAREQQTVDDFGAEGAVIVGKNILFWRGARKMYYYRNGIALACRDTMMALTAYLLFKDTFSFGVFMSLTQWAMQTVNATQELGDLQRTISHQWTHLELYLQLLSQPPDITTIEGAAAPARLRGAIEFSGVTYEYKSRPTEDPLKQANPTIAINNVSFFIPPGQKVALVGVSGAGKSTIAFLLLRSDNPKEGVIRIDGTDVRLLDKTTLRRRIGYVPQQPKVLDSTLRYNLTFGLVKPEAISDDELRKQLAVVKLEHLAEGYGLDSKLGESGYTLSGGEKQRISIARALIKDPDILIFDEATSSLDPFNEKKVQNAIDSTRGRTMIIIAHRYSTIRDVDRILVFDAGRLIDDGSHELLMKRCSFYRELLEQQRLK